MANALRIGCGLFVTDGNKGAARRAWQLVSRFTWELPQTLMGWLFAEMRNLAGFVDKVAFAGGATYAVNEHWHRGGCQGVSLGCFINIDSHGAVCDRHPTFDDAVTSDHLFMHEYGHYVQSQAWGPLYLLVVGLPSLTNCIHDTIRRTRTHDAFYTETSANRCARKYFGTHYGTGWDERHYPLA